MMEAVASKHRPIRNDVHIFIYTVIIYCFHGADEEHKLPAFFKKGSVTRNQ